jgi:exosortase
MFSDPARGLFHERLTDDDSGYGLLLFPVSLWLAWRGGVREDARPAVVSGTALLVAAILLRGMGSLAAEFFSQRFSIWLAIVGLVIFRFGWRQARHWWLPLALLALAIPLPALITNQLAIPLQFRASSMGTALIHWRHIPVQTAGNVIRLGDGSTLFVAEACSGLRSLTALLALGVMVGGMWLTTVPARLLVLLLAIPVAVMLNAIRVFLTAFLSYFVDPSLGQGFMHRSQGMVMFMVALLILGGLAAAARKVESLVVRTGRDHA